MQNFQNIGLNRDLFSPQIKEIIIIATEKIVNSSYVFITSQLKDHILTPTIINIVISLNKSAHTLARAANL